jgi:AhpD family alkylhydroperoxidase
MKSETLGERNNGESCASTSRSSDCRATTELEHLLEWARLMAARVTNNHPCIQQHQQRLRALGETEKRLNALDHWRQSFVFTEREKAALRLSETISWNDPAEYSLANLKAARSHLSIEETVGLALAVMAVNDWTYLHE